MSEALAVQERPTALAVVITNEQTELIRNTIAKEATDAELALFFYDCRRRGVHPLDKLIHFTKRGGKYTPVTSIDFFRSRAAETREHMGTDDVIFAGTPGEQDFQATVTVYRLVQGEKCPFTATARWAEYMPEPPNDFMWRKMPHWQLGKCSEALALRKGFPQELADLHTFEEMSQSFNDPPAAGTTKQDPPSVRRGQNGATPLPDGVVRIVDVREVNGTGKKTGKPFKKYVVTDSRGVKYDTFSESFAKLAAQCIQARTPVRLTYKETAFGNDLEKIDVYEPPAVVTETPAEAPAHGTAQPALQVDREPGSDDE